MTLPKRFGNMRGPQILGTRGGIGWRSPQPRSLAV